MRITQEGLIKIAEEYVERAVRNSRSLVAAYLYGAVNNDQGEPLIGGTADVDLVFIHDFEPSAEREFVRVSDDIHLDIVHHLRQKYRQTREMRVDPMLGYAVYYGRILYDPRHLMDFAQAGVRAQFFRPDYVLVRVRKQLAQARLGWSNLHHAEIVISPENILAYLDTLCLGANAVVGLNGAPLSIRRFLLEFPGRVTALSRPGLVAGLAGLLSSSHLDPGQLRAWLPAWDAAYNQAIQQNPTHPDLKLIRKAYYRRAIEALVEVNPAAALWILLYTWTQTIVALESEPLLAETWYMVLDGLGLGSDVLFHEKILGLDAYLDTIEDVITEWARARGVD